MAENETKNLSKETFTPFTEFNLLERLFYVGYAESEPILVYKNGDDEVSAVFRTLLPSELRDIVERMNKFESMMGKVITERIETLARAIVSINHMPLVWSTREQNEFLEKNKRNASPLEMARHIIEEKFKSIMMIDAFYDAYIKFSDSITQKFEDAKKNLIPPNTSSQT
jgi:hypothetical protein